MKTDSVKSKLKKIVRTLLCIITITILLQIITSPFIGIFWIMTDIVYWVIAAVIIMSIISGIISFNNIKDKKVVKLLYGILTSILSLILIPVAIIGGLLFLAKIISAR